MTKLKVWNSYHTWDEAESAWDEQAENAKKEKSIRSLKTLPNMVGITPETAKHLRWKAFKWMVAKDHGGKVLRGVLRHPFRYTWNYVKALFGTTKYIKEGDFFYYGIDGESDFKQLLLRKDTIFVVGFSYCHKPFECPSGRFTDQCVHDQENPVCQQCFIGKMMHAMPEKQTIPVVIPTVHHIGAKIFEVSHAYPDKQVIFLITACELTLDMFSDWGHMAGIKGVGVRLDGRICNTMEAFRLSEEGVKPGLTVVLDDTQQRMLHLIQVRRAVEKNRL